MNSKTFSPVVVVATACWLIAVPGCATTDYDRITDKIAAYEAQGATARVAVNTAKEPAQKVRGYNTLVSLKRKELEIARRINPETNPAYKSGAMTLQQAREEKAARVATIEQQLAKLITDRDAAIAAHGGARTETPEK